MTTTDLSEQLRDLSGLFLLIGNIERQIRRLTRGRFSRELLQAFAQGDPPRRVEGVEDLSLGEAIRLLRDPSCWSELGLSVSQTIVLSRLEEVRLLRNAVMHFRAEAATAEDLQKLRQTDDFLGAL